ncbi:MAG: hypothetical protein IJD04_06940 [Desulfovibrionaceae bacterium]|nr:hypothetical protein [Desulfovibrionaceae bacterium]
MSAQRRYCGRAEFLASLETILQLRSEGHSARSIYESLRAENKISISYRTFCFYVLKYKRNKKVEVNDTSPLPLRNNFPSRIISKEEKFDFRPPRKNTDAEVIGPEVLNKKE